MVIFCPCFFGTADEAALRELAAEDKRLQSFINTIEEEEVANDDPMDTEHGDSSMQQTDHLQHEQQRHQLLQQQHNKTNPGVDEDDDEIFTDLISNDYGPFEQQQQHGQESMDVDS